RWSGSGFPPDMPRDHVRPESLTYLVISEVAKDRISDIGFRIPDSQVLGMWGLISIRNSECVIWNRFFHGLSAVGAGALAGARLRNRRGGGRADPGGWRGWQALAGAGIAPAGLDPFGGRGL